jgi:ABC-2 type transport system ATP-binding protein
LSIFIEKIRKTTNGFAMSHATPSSEIVLRIKNLVKIYNNSAGVVRALDSVNLDIYQGEILALLGVNGAGKTTLSSILATLHPPTSGEIFFKNQSIYNNLAFYRQQLGYCSQRPNLDYELNVEENLLFAGRYFLVPEDQLRQRVFDLLEQFSLTKYAKFGAQQLSGGYKQRLLIARSLVHNPEIVILDEPTVALDPGVRHELWDSIRALKARGVTVILTTHYLEEAEVLSDRVCILDHGKILLTDRAEALKLEYNKSNLEEVFLHLTQEETTEK